MATETIISLDSRIKQDLLNLYKEQSDEGKLPSKQQLETYYATFRNKFGPEKLAGLDGEALLEAMHSHGNKDSLVYWLEFKDDEEFPALFGSIAGGSAHKFGLFRKKETGIWTSGSPQKPNELSVEQAIEKTRQHRDQLIRGFALLEKFPESGNDEQYAQLELDLQRVAPDVGNTAWGHKYLCLLFPNKLDDFHNPDYARFHLIKLLQLPPEGEGRYIAAGRYVSIARELNLPLHILTKLLNDRDGRNLHNYWRIATTRYLVQLGINTIRVESDKWSSNQRTNSDSISAHLHSEEREKPREYWSDMRDGNFTAIGWGEIGDLSDTGKDETGKQQLRVALQRLYPDKPSSTIWRQLFDFRWNIAIGDFVLAADGAKILGIGRVTGEYNFDSSSPFPHHRSVEWLSLEEWSQVDQTPDIQGKLNSVYKMKRPRNLIEVEKRILNATTPAPSSPPSSGLPFSEPHPRVLPRLNAIMESIQSILERKGQVILYGPPGTGKTYWAECTARELAARASFHTTFDQLTPDQKMVILGDNNTDNSRVKICCFHSAYGYEDFLEGFRPESSNGHMQFLPRAGIFKRLCQEAIASRQEKFYLVIDEINRGDIPRIFGELLTVLEKDKRGKAIYLPLTQQQFHVPDNVYIIGTMNTADRSIALLDAALRRRFGFIELMPDTEPLKKADVGGIPLGAWLEALNSRIRQYVGRDARNLQIGHAYLMKKGLPIADFTTLAQVIHEDILPLLEEYCYEDYSRLEHIMGSGLVDVKTQTIRHELFERAQQANLVQALLAPCPEITTSTQAAIAEGQTEIINEDEVTEDDGQEE